MAIRPLGILTAMEKSSILKITAKECAFIAVFVALNIATQLVLSALPGIELVTLLFISYSLAMGAKRGMISATVFCLLRQFIFGIFPNILILYLVYYNLLTLVFGTVGKFFKVTLKHAILIVFLACIFTALFTLLDDVITPLYLGYSLKAMKMYFLASLTVMIPHIVCTAVSVSLLFIPLYKVFNKLQAVLDRN